MKASSGLSTKQSIITSAAKLFFEKGISNTTVREIATKANVNLGSISYHFGSKDNIAIIVYENLNDEIFAQMDLSKYNLRTEAEKRYMDSLIGTDILFSNEKHLKFYVEMHKLDIVTNKPLAHTIERCKKILKEHSLDVSDDDHYKFILGFKGLERMYLIEMMENNIEMTIEEFNFLISSFYFYQIGLSERQIVSIADNCNNQYTVKHNKAMKKTHLSVQNQLFCLPTEYPSEF